MGRITTPNNIEKVQISNREEFMGMIAILEGIVPHVDKFFEVLPYMVQDFNLHSIL